MTSNQLDRLGFVAVNEKGAFYRSTGSHFTKILKKYSGYSFFDKTSNEWITLDDKGKEIVPRVKRSGASGKIVSKCGRVFTDGEKIFLRNLEKKIETLIPYKGNISCVFHDSPGRPISDFYSIEGDGSMICHYGSSRGLFRLYNTELEKQKLYDIRFFKAYDSSVLSSFSGAMEKDPDSSMGWSNNDPDLDHTQFIKIIELDSPKFLLLTRTPLYWHIYQMEWRWKQHAKKYKLEFTDLACFSTKREILAFTTARYNRTLFISFKSEGIRNFDIENGKLFENNDFYKRSQNVITEDIIEILPGYPYIYAVSGEDKIYRFSYDGWPDYPIQLKTGLRQALDIPRNILFEESPEKSNAFQRSGLGLDQANMDFLSDQAN